jgi:phenylpropionate dioxygenase-like ring-hydroxylating dioxygenase large terminal subunit
MRDIYLVYQISTGERTPMNHPAHVELARRLLAQIDGAPPFGARVAERPVAEYTSAPRFDEERAAVFARVPQLVAHASELAAPGACLTVDVAGVPLLLLTAEDGAIGAFRNACRHRSTRLVGAEAPCRKKALVCPYHGWTYDLRGHRIHAPHEESFRGETRGRTDLAPAYAWARHGFVWASLDGADIDGFLAPIASELDAMGAGSWVVHRRSSRVVDANWKLVIDAFLDGYHIRHLHRDSVYGFFLDGVSEAEPAGPHIRAATARRALLSARSEPLETADLRRLCTPSYLVFPNTIFVLHPDYVSVLDAQPVSVGRTVFRHAMLVPKAPASEAEMAHWEKSFALIDEGVFAREDLAIVEAMQRGIESGANETMLFGELEHVALWFHESLDDALGDAAGVRPTPRRSLPLAPRSPPASAGV